MATDLLPADLDDSPEDDRTLRSRPVPTGFRALVILFLRILASLKVTVGLFGLAVFLVFTGTLAQARHDIWWVVDGYFRTPLAWIEWNVFFPPAWFADYPALLNLKGSFPFPGGFTIGLLMAVNLLAAHGLRFKIQSSGNRLWGGLAVLAAGCALTWVVIVAGPDKDGLQATMPMEWITLWRIILLALAGSCVGIALALVRIDASRKLERGILLGVGCALLTLLGFLLFGVDIAGLNPSAMRILWQLIKAEAAALVLLAGCALVFRKRAGIVLLHAGVGLIMANELVVHFLHKEEQMHITEGETASYASDIRSLELVAIDPSASPTTDDVVAVPEQLLKDSLESKQPLSLPDRPFSVRLVQLYENAILPEVELDRGQKLPEDAVKQENLATAGMGKEISVFKLRAITGSDSGSGVNKPAAYAEILDSKTREPLGTYLLSVLLRPQKVLVDGHVSEIALRYERDYKPYSMRLHNVRADMYLGTGVPKNYSSELQLIDPGRNTDRRVMIRMNEPLRYGGETFYQSGYQRDERSGEEATTIQIVSNFGWMIPYIACMIVLTGMIWQFLQTMTRFLGRRDREGQVVRTQATYGSSMVVFPAIVVAACVGLIVYWSMPAKMVADQFDFESAGKIPILANGRIQPLDTLARNSLRMIAGREVFTDKSDKTQPAMLWLFDVIARPEIAREHRVYRIENPEVLAIFELERRKGFRYSPEELASHAADFQKQLKESKTDEGQYTIVEKKLQELHTRGDIYQRLADAFHIVPTPASAIVDPLPTIFSEVVEERAKRELPSFPSDKELQADTKAATQRAMIWLELGDLYNSFLMTAKAPLIVPEPPGAKEDTKDSESQDWRPYASAWLEGGRQMMQGEKPSAYLAGWQKIISAYAAQDAGKFNQAVKDYLAVVDRNPPSQLETARPGFEAWFNHAELFLLTQWWYFVAFCLVGLSWMTGWQPLNRSAFWLVAVLFVVHTFALVSRMMISGRPPVTNLYSSALFIGWAGVLFGLVLELVYRRLGFGLAIAAICGFSTLVIADKLALVVDGTTKGETISVMQAVLDTQFWLATHVTCITLGYATTYIAGLLGLIYVFAGAFTTALSKDISKVLARMTYGALCFALFFSFVGTVLGGLWADDSWGRFWGWDPKENGALIIVLWNALILHARWDGMVKDRGLAVLAIGGNIVTSWSWFGVNQLGVGLHSYGFTEGVLVALGVFCLSQMAMIGIGMMPVRYWMSSRRGVA